MGNQQTVQNHLDFTDLNTNYIYETKYTDHRFGEIKLLKKKDTSERIFQKDFTSNSAKEFEEYINKIKSRLPLLHPNLLKVLGYNSKKEDLFCADFFKISLFFESFETDLEKEIYRRHEANAPFTETELRCLLDSVIAAGAFLQTNQVHHGDIRPFNIFITKNREYKLCDNSLFHSVYNPAYFGLVEGLEAKSHFPSPQIFKHYNARQGKATDFNAYKNDVYGLGVSVLNAATLEKVDIYDYDKKRVRQDVLDNSLNQLRGRYSEGFVDALRVLLNPDEHQRPDFVELNEEIKGYRLDTRSKANLERMMESRRHEAEQRKLNQSPVKAGQTGTVNPLVVDDELDKRVRKAVQRSEEMANKSPSKYKNEIIDNCIQTYLKKDPLPQDYPLLYTISPHLTMENRFVPTLKVYSQENPNVGVSHYNVADVSSNLYASPDPHHTPYEQHQHPISSFAGDTGHHQVDPHSGMYQPNSGYQPTSGFQPQSGLDSATRRPDEGYTSYYASQYGGQSGNVQRQY